MAWGAKFARFARPPVKALLRLPTLWTGEIHSDLAYKATGIREILGAEIGDIEPGKCDVFSRTRFIGLVIGGGTRKWHSECLKEVFLISSENNIVDTRVLLHALL